jgi:hypothetical protein
MIPLTALFVTVHFAKRDGSVHKQRVTVLPGMRDHGQVIAAAVKGCKRRRIDIGNALRITHGESVLYDYVVDTRARFA